MAENLPENGLNPVTDSVNNEIIENIETAENAEAIIVPENVENNVGEIKSDAPTIIEVAPEEPAPAPEPVVAPEEPAPVPEPVVAPEEPAPVPEPVVAPEEPAPVSAPVVATPAPAPVMSEEQIAAKKAADEQKEAEKAARAKEREEQTAKFNAVFEELKGVKEANGTIEVKIIDRIRGGLRVNYQDMPMFLPASHFGLKRNPSEQSMKEAIGTTLPVHIHELQEDETKRKTVIVSRKQILDEKFWSSLTVGDIIEGPITSIASFGIFIDVYGVEGLVHVTRLSNTRIEDLKATFKKGQILKAVIVEVNQEQKRIGLSTKELEESPWKGLSKEIKDGTIIKGLVKRVTDFGAYIEIKPGLDGLIRTNELSWALRIINPSEILTANQEIDVYVISVNEDKRAAALSIKRISENPWPSLSEKYPAKTLVKGIIKQLTPQGAIVNINDEVDGFMPRSKMRFLPKDNINIGSEVEVLIENIDLEKESLIVLPPLEDKPQFKPKERDSKPRGESQPRFKAADMASSDSNEASAFTLQDLLSESMKKNLLEG